MESPHDGHARCSPVVHMAKHKSHKQKPSKKVKKALRKAAKKSPFAAALAIIGGELVAAAARARLDRRVVALVQRAADRLGMDGERDLATA